MRGIAVAAIILILASPVHAETITEDDKGDHEVTVAGVPAAGARWNALDLIGLDVEESLTGFDFALEVTDLAPPGEDLLLADTIDWFVYFSYRDAQYMLNIFRAGAAPLAQGLVFGATLNAYDAGADRWQRLESFAVKSDVSANTVAVFLPREYVIGADGAGTIVDGSIENIYVESGLFMEDFLANFLAPGPATVGVQGYDRMPDEGAAAWLIQEGIKQSGTASLISKAPVRVSNGEATTFLFELTAVNEADHQDTFEIKVTGAPSTWTVTVPKQTVRVEPDSKETFPILVTVPFQHQHGVFHPFMVTAQSRSDPDATGRMELGIRYTAVPQPSGHHDTLWLHGSGGFQRYINALEDDNVPEDEQEPMPGGGSCGFSGGGKSGRGTFVPLLPGLQIGLDFDMKALGEATFAISSDGPSEDKTYGGYFVAYKDGDRPSACLSQEPSGALARIDDTEVVGFDGAGTKTVTTTITPLEAGDYVPYDPTLNFALLLGEFRADDDIPVIIGGLDVGSATVDEGTFQLPLAEYHDDVDEYFASLSGIELYAKTQYRTANPGRTVIFNITAENVGAAAGTFDLSLSGGNVDWAKVLGSTHIQIPAQSSRQLAVAISVPTSARDGDQADVTLVARSSADENTQTLIRLVTLVDSTVDIPDEAYDAALLDGNLSDKSTPLPLLVPLAALLVGTVRRRLVTHRPCHDS